MTGLQKKLIDILDEFGYDIFSINMLRDTNELTPSEIHQALRSLTDSGFLIRLERSKYIRSSFSDSYVIGSFLASDGGIAYWSALNFHNLTEQFINVIFVQTARRRSEEVLINKQRYKFINIATNKLFGYKELGFGNHKYKITDIEKTIVDSFDLPHLSGWYQEIIKAFNQANINQARLIKYLKAINNKSVIKRIGYLAELLNKPDMEKLIEFAQSNVTLPYILFEIDGQKVGKNNSRWKMIINIPENEILEMANS